MLDLAEQIYSWLAQKRVEELRRQQEEAGEEGAGS
jgi:dsDNA-binding SOS-regulon protein